ncbi:MAG: serine acetyltransferase [Lachnospiraceae bacterium]|nr:serine acetyltransferase [Lachnospiraceae bacterium]MDE6251750.1 serine acetyltransferase [Lachnospiraceae bacterium]
MAEDINRIVESIVESYDRHQIITKIDRESQPNKSIIVDAIDKLQKIIFPGFFEEKNLKREYIRFYVGELCEDVEYNLNKQIVKAFLCCKKYQEVPSEELKSKTEAITNEFMQKIPKIREYLETDVQAAYEGDPAAYSMDEIIYSYPGIYAIMVSRIAHELHLLNVPLIPRIMTEHAHSITGIDIHPGASIGKYFFIDHGTGIVIGETTVIGEHVKIYQGVTLGGLSTSGGQGLKGTKRHPNIEDYVTIYSGASILGGETTIGEGTVIGGNAFVTKSVSANTKVIVKNPELKFKQEV